MSRPITSRRDIFIDSTPPPEQRTQVLWGAFNGIAPSLSVMPPDKAADAVGVRVTIAGQITAGEALEQLSDQQFLNLLSYEPSPDSLYVVGVRPTGFSIRSYMGDWNDFTGDPIPPLQPGDVTSLAVWGDKILLVGPSLGLIELDPALLTYRVVEEAPRGAHHVATFGGRVVLSRFANEPETVRWSARLDSNDWTGIGSGYEDLRTSGDRVWHIWPITDTMAIMVRERSIWIMSVTGNVDVPFRFERMMDIVGTKYPRTWVQLGRSVIGVTNDDVVAVGLDGLQSYGVPDIQEKLFTEFQGELDRAWGLYHRRYHEYWLGLDSGIWRCRLATKAWFRYPAPPSLAAVYIDSPAYGTYEQLVGSYEEQVEPMGEWNTSPGHQIVLLATPDGEMTIDPQGPSPEWEIVSGEWPQELRWVLLTSVVIEYDSPIDGDTPVYVELSSRGRDYERVGQFTPIGGERVRRHIIFRNTMHRSFLRLRLRGESLPPGFVLRGVYLNYYLGDVVWS